MSWVSNRTKPHMMSSPRYMWACQNTCQVRTHICKVYQWLDTQWSSVHTLKSMTDPKKTLSRDMKKSRDRPDIRVPADNNYSTLFCRNLMTNHFVDDMLTPNLPGTSSSCVWHTGHWGWSRWRSLMFPWTLSRWCWGDTNHHREFHWPLLTWFIVVSWFYLPWVDRDDKVQCGTEAQTWRDRGSQTPLNTMYGNHVSYDTPELSHNFTCEEGKPGQDGQSLPLRFRAMRRHGKPEHHCQGAEPWQQPALTARRTTDENTHNRTAHETDTCWPPDQKLIQIKPMWQKR